MKEYRWERRRTVRRRMRRMRKRRRVDWERRDTAGRKLDGVEDLERNTHSISSEEERRRRRRGGGGGGELPDELLMLSYSSSMSSTIWFWYTMWTAMLPVSVSGRSSVGPNTMATLWVVMRLASP
ncbi:hypothetical protein F7725_028721 [Dissostichus mawsoni]|uniref:Uncharacterized protein n=1 Tax=Dissostichus mawsoni TaxID=36200 RepID=A0A7J5XH42_DISMA|nr:hypothetical protein F7725_028721 [Dissostichus mawsoni]